MTITAALLDAVADYSQPMLTYYHDGTGERTELSAATLGNWAAKTANFLRDEVGVLAGDDVVVDLPEHWQTAAILLGAWWAGAHVHTGSSDVGHVSVAFVTLDDVDRYDADEVVVASLDPFALPLKDLPIGVADFGSAVRVHGDQYSAAGIAAGSALDGRSVTEVLDAARAGAVDAGITAGLRVLTTLPWHDADGIVGQLLAPLVVGASLVTVADPDPAKVEAKLAAERATSRMR
ncbi:TIGR03089 family protein [Gordonia sp. TBRC 11910]|uniref:TIGR03089 family protein n=1 Tax=Gordonia asplenii TaxID=2725283 RepID=A0A848KT24_9ACTN|nr:TIGR03089 family protein [Gordonia asplenii]NMO01147.1 TIGR03089 family protein [Gordonia asplenii]